MGHQNLGLGLTTLAITPTSATTLSYAVYKPDGTSLASATCNTSGSACAVNLANLAAGSYRVLVKPATTATAATFKVWASNDLTGTLVLNTAKAIAVTRNGQNGRYTFSGTASQVRKLAYASVATTPTGAGLTITVYKPDGTQLSTNNVTAASGTITLPTLPTTGTYTVLVEPQAAQAAATFSLNLTLQ